MICLNIDKIYDNYRVFLRIVILSLIPFLFLGCTIKPKIDSAKSVYVVIKTQKLKYADGGFLKRSNHAIQLELFNAGIAVLNLLINKNTCINKICYKKESFNAQFLGFRYYEDFLSHVILRKPIFNGKNLQKTDNGFTQEISSSQMDIIYRTTRETTYFKDKKHKILIKINDFTN